MAELMITKENFEELVLKADKPVIVDFFADWCGPCKMMGPILEEFAREHEGKFIVAKINVDDEEELAETYKVMSIPAIKIFKNGEVVSSAVGVQSKARLLEMLGDK